MHLHHRIGIHSSPIRCIGILCLLALLLLSRPAFSQVTDSAIRKVYVQGAINFRDLGGYTTTDGHHVKWHVIYRSADISHLTPADLDTLKARHIFYDVDLRGTMESAKAPDKINPGTDYILCPAGSDSLNAQMGKTMSMTRDGDSMMLAWYTNTAYLTARYQPFFQKLLILPDSDALLFHCTAGKDRTGIGAALLLYALGVPYETIKADYTATNYYRAQDNGRSLQMMVAQYHLNEGVARAMNGAEPQYLDATFDAIRRQYGSIDNYLQQQLGLDRQHLTLLRQKFLE
jgi:protein-tyrosine phosphatase